MTLTLILMTVATAALLHGLSRSRLAQLRKEGLYPPPGRATAAGADRSARAGCRIEAIRCHRAVHRSSLVRAKRAVDRLLRAGSRS